MGLQDLPPELLRRIFEEVLPYGLKLSFEQVQQWTKSDERRWTVYATNGQNETSVVVNALHKSCRCYQCRRLGTIKWHMSLVYVNKNISNEARSTFFRGNLFALRIDALPHKPLFLKSPLIFGPLGLPQRLHPLRDLKRIELTVHINERSLYAIRRHRERVQHFVDVLHAHAEDRSKKSLLQDLHVKLTISAPRDWTRRVQFSQYPDLNGFITLDQFEKHMFTLESLAEVTGVPTVIFDGIPGWWKQCLELRMQGGR